MPKYKVQTDQGNFMVELDKEPSSPDELQSLVTQHLSGGGQPKSLDFPTIAPQIAPKTQGQQLSPDTTFQPTGIDLKDESTLTKYARKPAELVGQIPVIGPYAKEFVPSTPGGLGGLIAGAAAAPFTGGMSLPATAAITGGAAALGGAGGSLLGGGTPEEALKEGAIQGAGQAAGLGVGKALGSGAGYVGRQLKGGTQKLLGDYGKKLAEFIPGVEDLTPSKFYDLVVGGKGQKALGAAYQEGIDQIKQLTGPKAFIQNPEVTQIIKENLPKGQYFSKIGNITSPITSQGATAPAHLVLGDSQPITIENAMKAAQELGARARLASKSPEGGILGRDLRQANQQLRETIANELDRISQGAGDLYRGINDQFRKGATVLEVLGDKATAKKIFPQGSPTKTTVDVAELQRAHDLALSRLRDIGGEDLATTARRGAPVGAGDVTREIPGARIFLGGGGRGYLGGGTGTIGIPSPAGGPGPQVPPQLSGPLGQMLAEYLKRRQQGGQ